MSIACRLAALLAVVIAIGLTHWRAYTLGATHERNATQAAQTQAVRESAAAAIRQADNTIEAQHDRAQTETRIAADRRATDRELDRLRTDLLAARSAATGADARATDTAASRQLLDSMAADIARLAEQGANIAAAADGHAADALMLQRACARP